MSKSFNGKSFSDPVGYTLYLLSHLVLIFDLIALLFLCVMWIYQNTPSDSPFYSDIQWCVNTISRLP